VRPAAITQELHRLTKPEKLMWIYRENTEDIYLGIEWRQGSEIGDRFICSTTNLSPLLLNMALSVSP